MAAALHQHTSAARGLLTGARQLFGGDTPPADPPAFAAPADLEADLGRGPFLGPMTQAARFDEQPHWDQDPGGLRAGGAGWAPPGADVFIDRADPYWGRVLGEAR